MTWIERLRCLVFPLGQKTVRSVQICCQIEIWRALIRESGAACVLHEKGCWLWLVRHCGVSVKTRNELDFKYQGIDTMTCNNQGSCKSPADHRLGKLSLPDSPAQAVLTVTNTECRPASPWLQGELQENDVRDISVPSRNNITGVQV